MGSVDLKDRDLEGLRCMDKHELWFCAGMMKELMLHVSDNFVRHVSYFHMTHVLRSHLTRALLSRPTHLACVLRLC